MLSILIPTYNYDCSALVRSLHAQAEECKISFEILVAEDGSERFLFENQTIEDLSFCRHIVLKNNIGRAGIRNFLANEAKFENLLFIDADSQPYTDNFIKNYLEKYQSDKILLGGRIYEKPTETTHTLLPKYGKKERNDNKNKHLAFTSPNFIISKNIYNQIKFDENIKDYGHEDTIFGITLLRKGFQYEFIDNPVIHIGIEDNYTFLKKTELSIQTLFQLYKAGNYPELKSTSKLLSLYLKLEKYHLTTIVAQLFSMFERFITKSLTSGNPNLTLLNCYKIGYLCHFAAKQ